MIFGRQTKETHLALSGDRWEARVHRQNVIWKDKVSMRNLLVSTIVASAAFIAMPAQAATVLPACSGSDISATPALSGSFSCKGFYKGNLLNQSSAGTVVPLLNQLLGSNVYSTNSFQFGSFLTISPLNGAKTVDFTTNPFNTKLNGMTLIGVHYGAGSGSPSDVAGNTRSDKSDSTAFYYFDAGKGLDKLNLNFGASSNLTLFSTQPMGAVPEPATWAMMIVGLGAVGAMLRYRRRRVSVGYQPA